MTTEAAPVMLRVEGAPPLHPLLDFMDRSIRRERRLEALLRRASRGRFDDDTREQLRFEAYEDREHARILRRHRLDVVRGMRVVARAPGARVAKVGRTVTAEAAMREALRLRAEALREYRSVLPSIEDRFLRVFVQVLASSQREGIERLRGVMERLGYSTASRPSPDRPKGPLHPLPVPGRARAAGAA